MLCAILKVAQGWEGMFSCQTCMEKCSLVNYWSILSEPGGEKQQQMGHVHFATWDLMGPFFTVIPCGETRTLTEKCLCPFYEVGYQKSEIFFFFWHTVPVSVALDRGSSECLKQIDLNFVKFWKEIFPPYVSSRQIQGKSFFLRNLKCLEEQQNLYIYFCLWWEGVCHLGCFCVPSVRSLSVRVADSLDLHVSFASAVLHARNFFKQEVISCSLGRCNFLPFLVGSTLWLSSLHEDKKVLVWSSWSCLFNRR